MRHDLGIAISIIGIWLSGAAVIGRKRLERWDASLRRWIRADDTALRRLKDRVRGLETTSALTRSRLEFRNLLILLVKMMACPIAAWLVFGGMDSTILLIVCIMIVFLGLAAFLPLSVTSLTIGVYLLMAIVWIALLPFRLVQLIESDGSLERTIIFVGLVCSTIGLMLLA